VTEAKEDRATRAEAPAPGDPVERVVLTIMSNEATDTLVGRPLPLSKTFTLNHDGSLTKTTSAQLTHGRAKQQSVASFAEFAALLGSLKPHQALAYGVAAQPDARVVTKDELPATPGAIARSRKYFRFRSAPSVMFVDYDAPEGAAPALPDELRDMLIHASPALAEAPMLAQSSASSFIYHGDTQLRGAGGWHLYIAVRDGSDILRAGGALYEHLWRIGAGYYVVSKSARLLDRNLIDRSVWQPERLDFAGGAECVPPLEQRRPSIKLWNADAPLFDTQRIVDPTREEQEIISRNRAVAREAVEDKRRSMRTEYTGARCKELVARGINEADANTVIAEALDRSVLLGDFLLITSSGERVTVAQVLARKTEYHGARFADPLDIDYRQDHRIAVANLCGGGRPYIYSHAHGGCRFELYPQPRVLQIQRGELPRLADKVLDVMRVAADVYDQPVGRGQCRLVYARDGHLIPVTDPWLRTYIGRLVRCERFDKRSNKSEAADVPRELVEAIQSNTTDRRLNVLEAVVSDPIMRLDGSILDVPGYSARDRLLFESGATDPPRVPNDPTDEQVRTAFGELWHPFIQFPFVDDCDRAAIVAALLTAVVRPILETAPGFVFDAPSAGSGKTRLAQCVSWVAGVAPHEEAPPSTDEETAKRLFSLLRGGAKVILWDNYTQPVYGNSALCAFLTAGQYTSRVLGVSQTETVANRAMFLATGNNIRVQGDACRRLLKCRIDAGIERPSMRTFDLEPATWVRDHRQTMRVAALTILRGFQSRGAPRQIGTTAGSFENWDRLVRQCVVWLGRSGLASVGLGDPYTSAEANMDSDSEMEVLLDLMKAWRSTFEDRWISAGDALRSAPFSSLNDAINAITGGDHTFNDRRFGRWLQKHRDLPVSGLKIVSKREDNANRYAVIRTSASATRDVSRVPNVNSTAVAPCTEAPELEADAEARAALESIADLLGPREFIEQLLQAKKPQ
jgi:hypothetical protein